MGPPRTCWSLIRDAADGAARARDEFVERYEPALRAYLGARWRGQARISDLDDAVQDIFLECMKPDGALASVDPSKGASFRAFLYGVARRVALRYETAHGRRQPERLATSAEEALGARERQLSDVFDRAFAQAVMQQAMRRQIELASKRDEGALERVELLRLRFQRQQPIRDIARAWDRDPALLHRAYARARSEFREALLEVIEFHGAPTRGEAERRAAALLEMLA